MSWIKRNSKTEYLEFVGSIEAKITTVPYAPQEKRALWIRHDVDKSLDHALRLAEYEYRNNIQSTYFLLHTNDYFDYSTYMEITDFQIFTSKSLLTSFASMPA